MKYKPYPRYKDSGIQCYRKIPKAWAVRSLRYICQLKYGNPLTSDMRHDEGDIEVFGASGAIGRHCAANTNAPVIIIGRKGSAGKIKFSDKPVFAINTTYYLDNQSTKQNLRWLNYVLQTLNLDISLRDSTIPDLSKEEIYDNKVVLPSLEEQEAIASFLDHKTSRIDTLISKQDAMIEKLHEKKEALIFHTINKGLPSGMAKEYKLKPHLRFKDSKIQWVGEIPENWNLRKLATLIQLKNGINITSEEMLDGGDIPVYGGNGIRGYYNEYTHDGEYILVGRQGTFCGNVHKANGKFWASEHTFIVNPISRFNVNWMFMRLAALSLNRFSVSAAQPGLHAEQITSLRIPYPPLEEQEAIADFLEKEINRINALIARVEKAVSSLREYREALILVAVTGKIDVRIHDKIS